jgi:hypothetical protein
VVDEVTRNDELVVEEGAVAPGSNEVLVVVGRARVVVVANVAGGPEV